MVNPLYSPSPGRYESGIPADSRMAQGPTTSPQPNPTPNPSSRP